MVCLNACVHTAVAVVVSLASCAVAQADVLLDNSSPGYHNAAIGTLLDGTEEVFPILECTMGGGGPEIDPAPQPLLLAARQALGPWLAGPPPANANWNALPSIPSSWPLCTEDAIVYVITLPIEHEDVVISIGVDNGAFVWLDGVYLAGQVNAGLPVAGELTIPVGTLPAGVHHLAILREDHGFANGFLISVTGCPSPHADADLNGDCEVDGADLGVLLSAWGLCASGLPCPGDLNGDGAVGGGDLGALLAQWTD